MLLWSIWSASFFVCFILRSLSASFFVCFILRLLHSSFFVCFILRARSQWLYGGRRQKLTEVKRARWRPQYRKCVENITGTQVSTMLSETTNLIELFSLRLTIVRGHNFKMVAHMGQDQKSTCFISQSHISSDGRDHVLVHGKCNKVLTITSQVYTEVVYSRWRLLNRKCTFKTRRNRFDG